MLIRKTRSIAPSELTPETDYLNRRQLIAAGLGVASTGAGLILPGAWGLADTAALQARKSTYSTNEPPSRYRDITTYNNFIEFGARKTDPSYFANALTTRPWTVMVDGLVRTPRTLDWDDLFNRFDLEERIYRLRCVEAWSMVVPWVGFPLSRLLGLVEPLGSAKYVRFETVYRPKEMRGQRKARPIIQWPYVEGLRLDEALHPLTILAVGLYGRRLPNQNGAPIRLVVPWKYGFKSIKSIVRITLTEEQPVTSWNRQSPQEYGFYANVNPEVDHPSWSQARERRVGFGTSRFSAWRPTLMFNGYGEQVSHLYSGMDLRKNF